MLYKTFNSDYDVYQETCPTLIPSRSWNYCLAAPPREYHETFNAVPGCVGQGELYAVWTTDVAKRVESGGVNSIYIMGQTSRAGGWSGQCEANAGIYQQQSIHIAKFDGANGTFLWSEMDVYAGLDFDFLHVDYYFSDQESRIWSKYFWGASGFVLRRHKEFDGTEFPSNDKTLGAGMPVLANGYKDPGLDMYLQDSQWLNKDGGVAYGHLNYHRNLVLNVSVPGDWCAMTYDRAADDTVTDPFLRDNRHTVHIHSLSTRRRLGSVFCKGKPYRGIAVDNATLYVFTNQGTIEVINAQTASHLGVLHFQDFTGSHGWLGDSIALCMDKNYRRLLSYQIRPDEDVTGRCKMYVEGWAPIEVAEYVMAPIPLEVPVEGKSIRVLTRAYGWGGLGTAGVQITASITAGDGSVSDRTTTDSGGYAILHWTCGSEGTLVETIEVSAEVEQSAPGIPEPESYVVSLPPPASITFNDQLDQFSPGHWIYVPFSQKSTGSVETAIGGYLDDYDVDGEDRNLTFQGALVEYTWDEIETSYNSYNTSKISTDVNYLAELGLKTIIAIKMSDSTPDYISGGDPLVYGEALTCLLAPAGAGKTAGVFRAGYEPNDLYADDRCMPLLTNGVVKGRYSALISAIGSVFNNNENVIGYVPFEAVRVTGSPDLYSIDSSLSEWFTIRREILQTAAIGGKVVYDWLSNHYENDSSGASSYGSHDDWCANNYVGLLQPMFFLDNHNGRGVSSTSLLTQKDGKVPTGVVLPTSGFTSTHNLDCDDPTPSQATFKEVLISSINSDTECLKQGVEYYAPWMVFTQLSAGVWDVDDESVMTVIDEYRLQKEQKYNR